MCAARADLYVSQDTLTGQPVAEDTVMFAVPMCAPWSTLQSFKYKVRVIECRSLL